MRQRVVLKVTKLGCVCRVARHFVLRPRLDENKAKLPERESNEVEGADDVDEIFRQIFFSAGGLACI